MNKTHNNLTIENLMKTDWKNQFDREQLYQIKMDLESNVDVSIYASQSTKEFKCMKLEKV